VTGMKRTSAREPVRVGAAAWSIPKQRTADFPPTGSHLERYAQRLNAVEINTSFHRPHRRTTYERWSASVPDGFAFAVKAPQEITHERRLAGTEAALDRFLDESRGLGVKLGPLLFQLPPSLVFDPVVTDAFLAGLRARHHGDVVWEPRHPTWFTVEADDMLVRHRIARVAADPAVVPRAQEPGGWRDVVYRRLHGAPRIYYSDYQADRLAQTADVLTQEAQAGRRVWCIFDNTALGHATGNALAVDDMLSCSATA
jgi:uncharacterized protein YecE (DUF72 family)